MLFYNIFLCKVYKIVFNPSVENSNKNKRLKNLAPPNCGTV
jgi:hypothetical protein